MNITDTIAAIWAAGDEGQRAITQIRAARAEDVDLLFELEQVEFRKSKRTTKVVRAVLSSAAVFFSILTYLLFFQHLHTWVAACIPWLAVLILILATAATTVLFAPSRAYLMVAMAISYSEDDRTLPVLLRSMHSVREFPMFVMPRFGVNSFERSFVFPGITLREIVGVLKERVMTVASVPFFESDSVHCYYLSCILHELYMRFSLSEQDATFAVRLIAIPSFAKYWRTKRLLKMFARRNSNDPTRAIIEEASRAALRLNGIESV